jgi:hypothetical protein
MPVLKFQILNQFRLFEQQIFHVRRLSVGHKLMKKSINYKLVKYELGIVILPQPNVSVRKIAARNLGIFNLINVRQVTSGFEFELDQQQSN